MEVGTDQEVDAEEANAAHPPYLTPAAASVTMASSISLLNKLVVFFTYVSKTEDRTLSFRTSQILYHHLFKVHGREAAQTDSVVSF